MIEYQKGRPYRGRPSCSVSFLKKRARALLGSGGAPSHQPDGMPGFSSTWSVWVKVKSPIVMTTV